jgi:carbonic anhydrase
MENRKLGLIDNWLRHVQDIVKKHESSLSNITDEGKRFKRVCELNVIEQVCDVSETTIVERAWEQGQELSIHGWVYDISDGLLQDLRMSVSSREEVGKIYSEAIRLEE